MVPEEDIIHKGIFFLK